MSLDDIEARARELVGTDITEVHIVGGVHPKHDLDTYCAMIRRVKGVLPHVTVKAYTAVEIFYMIRHEGVSIVEGLRRLKEAGMECIPGGGAEIFDAELRKKICPDKCSAEEWLAVHRAAHNMGIATNCTMLYGHIESLEQRIDHLERLRTLQDEAPGFDAFIPLKYHSRGNRMSDAGECSVEDDLRMIAIGRIFLDNIPHIKAYWVSYGRATTEMALMFGADDIDGTIGDTTKIYSMAGGVARPTMSVAELEAMVTAAGFHPVERDSHYNAVVRGEDDEAGDTDEEDAPTPSVVTEVKEQDMQKKTDTKTKTPAAKRHAAKPRRSGAKSSEGLFSRVMSFRKRYPILANMVFIGIFALMLLICLSVGLKRGTRLGSTIEVPNLLGMDVDDARGVLEREDLQIVVRDSIFDVDLPGGTIVDQLPRTSSVREVTVKPGRKIYVTINAYSRRMVDVPFVAKQTLRQALNQIERSGLTISKLVYEPDMTSTDYVLRQYVDRREIQPTTSRKCPVGTGVTLTVSYRRDEQMVYTPRLVGLSLQQAKGVLWDNGLNVGRVVYDDSVEDLIAQRKARVYRQSQSLGTMLNRGDEVTLYLSCDETLVDSMNVIASRDLKSFEEQRRKALAEQADSLKEVL
jgi:aminodeoxyfutalosine synthase